MKVNPLLKFAVDAMNKYTNLGKVRVIAWDEYVKTEMVHNFNNSVDETYAAFLKCRNIHFLPAPDCIVVDYDFTLDELDDQPEEREKFDKLIDAFYQGLINQPNALFDIDGSGNGLMYGLNIYAAK